MSTPNSFSATPVKAMSPAVHTPIPAASQPGTPGSAPPTPLLAASPSTAAKSQSTTKPKPVNVFSNDGSFLERFQRTKKAKEERRRQEELLAKKRAFDERFKTRGKRKTDDAPETDTADAVPPAKKPKELTQYEKEVKSYEGRSLKDNGIGIRPLVK
ncbi:hypothetical protein FRB99_008272 [Tulasnella sp. 403]|nr:hypothetical protein FRB99_008272 [Tulasnella sp. 403]